MKCFTVGLGHYILPKCNLEISKKKSNKVRKKNHKIFRLFLDYFLSSFAILQYVVAVIRILYRILYHKSQYFYFIMHIHVTAYYFLVVDTILKHN